MDDPYHDDDSVSNEFNDDFTAKDPPLLKAFKHVGHSIRDGGFCSPNGKRKSYESSSSITSNGLCPDKVNMVISNEVDPLIIKEDLVMDAEYHENLSQSNTLKEQNEVTAKKAMVQIRPSKLKSILIPVALVVAVALACFLSERTPTQINRDIYFRQFPIFKGILATLSAMVATKVYLSSGFVIIFELFWSAIILCFVFTGIYYTYDLEWSS